MDTAAVAAATGLPGNAVALEEELLGESDECLGGVLVFTQGGYLSLLEVYSWADGKVTLTEARRMVHPATG
ncbi:hypothetical protein P3T27_002520 [Kitasatospora sp. MAA19]|uniref:hypothetical protein n=1 Tax=Kitasatospora sp. MAA19 TaxID=3035090 RepID=UPI0024734779|nr:hypothetical protein [Kitasatospora sp. MAA19]MDH6705798.1 hypothetical protein [Kitasatospora sp. MAA19]